jgi:glutathione S-transferase
VQRLRGAPGDLPGAQARAHVLFKQMDAHLARRSFLLGEALSLADIANYAYVALAPEGGIALDGYGYLRAWLARIEATPRFVPMLRTAVPLT